MPPTDDAAMDALAESVSQHGSVARAARELKISRFRADFLWMRICARLGPQAR